MGAAAAQPKQQEQPEQQRPPGQQSPQQQPRRNGEAPATNAMQVSASQARLAKAQQKASQGALQPLWHGRCCVILLMVLCTIRLLACYMGNIPGGTIWLVHVLSLGTDMCCVTVTLPLLVCGQLGGVEGQCVKLGCIGPMMTMVVAMNLVDWSALVSFFAFAAPRPMPAEGKSYMDVLEFFVGIWELVLVASCALNFAVCVSCWRIYRELRAAGLYPPNSRKETPREQVSPFEVLCEAEDVALLAECGRSRQQELAKCCNTRGHQDPVEILVAQTSPIDTFGTKPDEPLEQAPSPFSRHSH